MKNPVAFFLAILAFALAAIALYGSHAEANVTPPPDEQVTTTQTFGATTIKTTILDNSKYPEILVALECTGDNVDAVVTPCRAELLKQCPDGGNVEAIAETPVGVMPMGIHLIVRCVHEPSI